MFRIKSITLYNGTKEKKYSFSDNVYVYGQNNVGKTAFTKALDFVLGCSDPLRHDGLDYIDAVGASYANEKTELWVKRTTRNEFFYKRTEASDFTLISFETYKDLICELISEAPNGKLVKVYQRVFEESPTYRAFVFLNYVDEIGQGDLGAIFTRGKEIKHYVRIRNIMDFFFNYENIEKLYEKRIELDGVEMELKKYMASLNQYTNSVSRIKSIFLELGLPLSESMKENYEVFRGFKYDFSRKDIRSKGDLVYLSKVSQNLSEEIKLYTFLKKQGKEAGNRKARTERLLSTLKSIIAENENYKEDVNSITKVIEEIKHDQLILSVADYDSSILKIARHKKGIDEKIRELQNQAKEIDYDSAMKKIALLEEHFSIINSSVDVEKGEALTERVNSLKKEIREIKNYYSQKNIQVFNERLTKMYLDSDVHKVSHLEDDRKKEKYSLWFDPFSQVLVEKHKEDDALVTYSPGSQARHSHLQLLVYLCMHDYLQSFFADFICLPLLIIDSADQSMDNQSFEEIYPSIVSIAKRIGVQTIFISKYRPKCVDDDNLIDLQQGFNPFHKSKRQENNIVDAEEKTD